MRFGKFISELPYKLQIELSEQMHQKIYMNVAFFKSKDASFINWIGLLLKNVQFFESEYITQEGDDITESKLQFYIDLSCSIFCD